MFVLPPAILLLLLYAPTSAIPAYTSVCRQTFILLSHLCSLLPTSASKCFDGSGASSPISDSVYGVGGNYRCLVAIASMSSSDHQLISSTSGLSSSQHCVLDTLQTVP